MLTTADFLTEIESYMGAAKMSASAFGKAAVGDPNFVRDMKEKGRAPSLRLVERVSEFIERNPPNGGSE